MNDLKHVQTLNIVRGLIKPFDDLERKLFCILQTRRHNVQAWGYVSDLSQNTELKLHYAQGMHQCMEELNKPAAYLAGLIFAERTGKKELRKDLKQKFTENVKKHHATASYLRAIRRLDKEGLTELRTELIEDWLQKDPFFAGLICLMYWKPNHKTGLIYSPL